MGLLDGFEKLINEHGSAAILKERISLAEDKYAALEQKLVASTLRAETAELRVNNLESENQRLNIDLERAKIEIQNLKKLTEQVHGSRLEEIKEKLLQLLAARQDSKSQQLAHALGVNDQLITFHLTELQDTEFVHASYFMNGGTEWPIAHEGRRYLVTHDLLA